MTDSTETLKSENEVDNILINNQSVYIYLQKLISLEQVIFNLTEKNFEISVAKTMNLFDKDFPFTFNYCIIVLIYSAFSSQRESIQTYLNYLQEIQTQEEAILHNNPKIIEIFTNYISEFNTQETYYIIEKMIEKELININITKNFHTNYFSHYKTEEENKKNDSKDPLNKEFKNNYEKLSKNDWELHKQLVKEGVNPNEISKIIRNDDIEKLQEISSQEDFDFNQTIKPSLYERYSFINKENVTLIDFAAFFGAIQCFKYLLLNNAKVENTGKYAIAGGNLEIIYLCEQNHSTFDDVFEIAIKFHRNDIFKYIYENKIEKLDQNNQQHLLTYVSTNKIPFKNFGYYINNTQTLTDIKFQEQIYQCINIGNYEILSFLEEEIKFDEYIINVSAKTGNLYLVEYFLDHNQIPKNILVFALESGNIELIQYIIKQEGIDINAKNINLFVLKYVLMF